MPIHTDKIQEVLRRPGFEGPQQLRGYIPCDLTTGGTANYKGGPNPERYVAMGASGVTIGTGVDLGQTNKDTLRGMGVSNAVVYKLMPYLGQRKAAAVAVLYRLPLTLSQAVADELDAAMLNHHITKIADYYDRAVGLPGCFATLPWQAQAVIFSCCFQKGCGGVRRDWPKLWGYLTRQDWSKATHELKYGFTQYKARRRIEGELLGEIAQCSA